MLASFERSRMQNRIRKAGRRINRIQKTLLSSTDPSQGEKLSQRVVDEGLVISRLTDALLMDEIARAQVNPPKDAGPDDVVGIV